MAVNRTIFLDTMREINGVGRREMITSYVRNGFLVVILSSAEQFNGDGDF